MPKAPRALSLLTALLFLSFMPFAAAQTQVQTYDQLIHAIREVRHASEARVETAVEQEKVREAWETGKLIQEHILLNKNRADYGQKVLKNLSADLETNVREIQYMVEFARTYPNALPGAQLSWSHYKALLDVKKPEERERVSREAVKKHWNRNQIREEVRSLNLPLSSPPAGGGSAPGGNTAPLVEEPKLAEVKPGKIGVYPVLEINGKKYHDLGFAVYSEIKGKAPKQTNPPAEDLYTYNAQVKEIYDGDTFYARIDLGFGILVTQQLRLRRIDAPELVSADGKEAKAVLEKILNRGKGRIVIKTSKGEDQFGRYLVDIWVQGKAIEQELLDSGVFLERDEA